ncbi:MAG: hypothetical protein NTX25_17815 [Proteobacteria bacterium]|nr:hypothetical protein [Pseudomonadota bacterium]
MKQFISVIILFLAFSCAKSKSDEPQLVRVSSTNNLEEKDSSGSFSAVVATAGDLPSCKARNRSQLIYLIDDKKFVTCDGTDWQEIEINKAAPMPAPAPAVPGLTITSIQEIKAAGMNLCVTIACYFNGGQLTTYSDGTKLITGSATRIDTTITPNSTDRSGFSLFIPPKLESYVTGILDRGIRTVGAANNFVNIYMVYNRKADSLTLYSDNTMNGLNLPEDTAIVTVEVSAAAAL